MSNEFVTVPSELFRDVYKEVVHNAHVKKEDKLTDAEFSQAVCFLSVDKSRGWAFLDGTVFCAFEKGTPV